MGFWQLGRDLCWGRNQRPKPEEGKNPGSDHGDSEEMMAVMTMTTVMTTVVIVTVDNFLLFERG